jgi:hypothetical protein
LRRLNLAQLPLQIRYLAAGAGELTSFGAPILGDHDLLPQEAQPRPGEAVALPQRLCGQRLLPGLETTQTSRLSGHRAPRCPNLGDDLDILPADPLGERDLLEQILKTARLQHNADDVWAIGLICVNQLLGKGELGMSLERLQLR